MKRILAIALCLAMLAAYGAAWAKAKNPDMYILAHSNTTITLDPGTCYSSTAWAKIMNIYEPLVFFKGSSTEEYKPVLATEVPTKANGGISADGTVYTFKIRKGVKFQNGNDLTAEDVEYTFKRALIVDQMGGPTWMLLEALFGIGSTRGKDGKMIPGLAEKIDKAITVKGDAVSFKLHKPFPPFLALVAFANGLVIDKQWSIKQGCWDGDIANAAKYNNPGMGKEPLHKVTNGTGPYMLKDWKPNVSMTFERNQAYWGKKPAIKTAVVKIVKEWSTRKLMLQNGDVDRANVDAPYIPEVKDMKNLSFYESAELGMYAGFFNQNIEPTGNPYIGSGKLDGNGIPLDFFSDLNVRKAFAHCFDRATYKEDVFNGRVILPTSPVIKGLPYHKDVPVHEFDLKKAAEYMKKAWGGKVWDKGFKMSIVYFTGKATLEAAANILAEHVNALNPKFRVEVINITLKDFNAQYRDRIFPIFMTGWGADYPDPHNFAQPFMHSAGAYGRGSGLSDKEVDGLIQKGIATVEPEKRRKIYHRIQELYYERAMGLPLYQPTQFRAYRDWVKGYIPHPMLTDANEMFWNLSK
jgi:peptide/nickel transport system substrate-binding protein